MVFYWPFSLLQGIEKNSFFHRIERGQCLESKKTIRINESAESGVFPPLTGDRQHTHFASMATFLYSFMSQAGGSLSPFPSVGYSGTCTPSPPPTLLSSPLSSFSFFGCLQHCFFIGSQQHLIGAMNRSNKPNIHHR